jgi:hypothetical protein
MRRLPHPARARTAIAVAALMVIMVFFIGWVTRQMGR